MELSDALHIIKQYRHRFGDVYLQEDHICAFQQPHTRPCPHFPDSAIYTRRDAMQDAPDSLANRLRQGDNLKP